MGGRLALLIATHEHDDPTLRRLTAPAADAEALAAVLRDPQIAGFEVTVLVNEPHYRVGEAISELYRDRRRDDLTLLYFTGHGLKDDDGRLYLATSNTRRDSLLFTSLPAEQLDYALEGCASRQKVVVLDCCYSGAFPAGRGIKADSDVHALEKLQGTGRTVLTASDSAQYSFEGDRVLGSATQSVFTRHLVEGLREGSADLDGDGDITVDELYSYVHDRVVEEMPRQRPKKKSDVAGRIVIARNVAWTLPGYLRNALSSPIPGDRHGALDPLMHLHRIGNPSVRARVEGEIERLAADDSRLVSSAAAARLQVLRPAPPVAAPRPPEPAVLPVAARPRQPAVPAPAVPSGRPVHDDRPVGPVPDSPPVRRGPLDDAPDVDRAGDGPARAPVWWWSIVRARRRPVLVVGVLALVTATGVVIATLVPDGTTGGGSDPPPAEPAVGAIATIGTIPVGPDPRGIDFFTDRDGGRRAAVAVGAGVTLVDPTNNVVDKTLDLEMQGSDVAVARESSRTYVATAGGLLEINSAPSAPVVRGFVLEGEEVHLVAAAPDGNRVYATTGSVLAAVDLQTDAVSTVNLAGPKFGLEVSPDGARVYVANAGRNTVSVIDAATLDVERTIETGVFTRDVALSPTGPTGYVAQALAVGVFATDGTTPEFTTIPVPGGDVLEAVAVTPDGRRVFAVTRHGGRVIEIDARTRTVTRMTAPDPAATAADIAVTDDRAYVSMRSSDRLLVLDISP